MTERSLVYVHNREITRCIEYALNSIDQNPSLQSTTIIYVNCTIPDQLFNNINSLPVRFKQNPEVMKSFHYHKIGDLIELNDLISNQNTETVIIIESIEQLIRLTNLNYSEVNSLLNRALLRLKRYRLSMLLNRYPSNYIEYFSNEVLGV